MPFTMGKMPFKPRFFNRIWRTKKVRCGRANAERRLGTGRSYRQTVRSECSATVQDRQGQSEEPYKIFWGNIGYSVWNVSERQRPHKGAGRYAHLLRVAAVSVKALGSRRQGSRKFGNFYEQLQDKIKVDCSGTPNIR